MPTRRYRNSQEEPADPRFEALDKYYRGFAQSNPSEQKELLAKLQSLGRRMQKDLDAASRKPR